MSIFQKLFRQKPHIIGMIHVRTLPDLLGRNSSLDEIIDKACTESEIYKECGVDSVLIENMHDVPYLQPESMEPEVTSIMTRICTEVRRCLPKTMNCGVQILAGANKEALAVALASNLQFIRAEGYVYSQISDEGLMNACAGTLFRYRRNIQAENVLIFTDIKKKHCSHTITSDLSISDIAKAAEFFLSDGVIITGHFTGTPANIEEFHAVKKSCKIPVIIGSGVNSENICEYRDADAIIIGSDFKRDGR
ncbi:UNVERIFIED_CONTAM: hypothetical protein PYX00_001198 [Menopon gallinae]|uniref:BtpA family protein n=1 Tax=Menopon gallinae TaxID=328185 RepID=A0AAW2ID41_9NEOP